jgi:hypothetical protein
VKLNVGAKGKGIFVEARQFFLHVTLFGWPTSVGLCFHPSDLSVELYPFSDGFVHKLVVPEF